MEFKANLGGAKSISVKHLVLFAVIILPMFIGEYLTKKFTENEINFHLDALFTEKLDKGA